MQVQAWTELLFRNAILVVLLVVDPPAQLVLLAVDLALFLRGELTPIRLRHLHINIA